MRPSSSLALRAAEYDGPMFVLPHQREVHVGHPHNCSIVHLVRSAKTGEFVSRLVLAWGHMELVPALLLIVSAGNENPEETPPLKGTKPIPALVAVLRPTLASGTEEKREFGVQRLSVQ